jgi:hypothetical protein
VPDRSSPILPSTKVGALLDVYPELEDVLIGLAPPFRKLKNRILRKSIGKVASLQQVAAVGGISVQELVNTLRAAVGQEAIAPEGPDQGRESYFLSRPDWFDSTRIVASIDERRGDSNKMPVAAVLQQAAGLQPMEILELITSFLPAPGIDILRKKGLLVWSVAEQPKLIRTYVSKPRSL